MRSDANRNANQQTKRARYGRNPHRPPSGEETPRISFEFARVPMSRKERRKTPPTADGAKKTNPVPTIHPSPRSTTTPPKQARMETLEKPIP